MLITCCMQFFKKGIQKVFFYNFIKVKWIFFYKSQMDFFYKNIFYNFNFSRIFFYKFFLPQQK